jgi:FHS family L-fucose permease-like MFS transporter
MVNPISSTATPSGDPLMSDSARRTALVTVTTLFFMWGFMTCLNDILIPHLKSVFELTYVKASLIQFTFFGAYFLMSLPAGRLIAAIGYQRTLLFYPAASALSYGLFLFGLFVLSTGITILQVAANPYISALGKPETASSRLNLAQAFNSLGTTLAPFFGGWLILASPAGTQVTSKLAEASSVKVPYLELTGALVLLAVVLAMIKLPSLSNVAEETTHPGTWRDTLRIPHLSLGAVGIFLYVGAEVSIGSYLVSFMMDPAVGGLTKEAAAGYLSYYWGGAMVGRFIGSALLQGIRAHVLLAVNAVIAMSLGIFGFLTTGHVAMYAVLAIGFFNSVMFPNIFTLGIAELGHRTSRGSSILIMAIVGGAVVPVLMGKMADTVGVHHSLSGYRTK